VNPASEFLKCDRYAYSFGWDSQVARLLALLGILIGARRKRDSLPFAMTVLFYLAAYLTLGVMFWPYMLPYTIAVASAAGRKLR
jgi:cytochrome d ubiquinol oxidase subunit II